MAPAFALVTGGARRIGKALAHALAGMGYDIFLHYHSSKAQARETKRLIEATGRQCILMQANFRDTAAARALINECADKGPLEILVNSASNFVASNMDTEGAELLDDLFAVNFKAPYLLTKQFARRCAQGLIVNLLDTKIAQHRSGHLDYLLTKKTLETFTYLSATQLAPDIRVNGIAPGLVLPPVGKPENYLRKKAINIPLRQIGEVKQLCRTLQFFVENEFVTGEVIYVDGGEHL